MGAYQPSHQVSRELVVLRLLRWEPLGPEAASAARELACCSGEGMPPHCGALDVRHCAPMGDQPGGLVPDQATAGCTCVITRCRGAGMQALHRPAMCPRSTYAPSLGFCANTRRLGHDGRFYF